jgi:putative tricarboxylic transport membrane protein
MMADLVAGFATAMEPTNFLMILVGTMLGLFAGALPGLSSPMAIVVLLPLTYTMNALPALLVMIGVYVGTKLGGSFAAVLLRTPGTPGAACTALDGFPMAERGQAGLALGYATVGSTAGGVFGWLLAIIFIPLLSTVAVKSSNADIALVGVMGLFMVSAFVRGSMLRGLIGVFLGLLISTVGLDKIDASERLTFGNIDLLSGVPFAAALTGFFGIAVVLSDVKLIGRKEVLITDKVNMALPTFRDMAARWRAMLTGAFFGTGVGAIPGVGAEGATWVAYASIRGQSKNPENFGKGEPDGIVAPEAANNATTGGTMVPMLTLGIPGDGSTAVILGAFILHGIEPGVLLMQTSSELVYGMLAGLLISTILMFLIAWLAIRVFIYMLQQDRSWLFPMVLVLACLGAFATMGSAFPVYVAIVLGVVGFLMEKARFPVVTVVLGIILGPIIEENIRLALVLSGDNWGTFVATWPRIALVSVIVVLLAWEVYRQVSGTEPEAVRNDQPIGD